MLDTRVSLTDVLIDTSFSWVNAVFTSIIALWLHNLTSLTMEIREAANAKNDLIDTGIPLATDKTRQKKFESPIQREISTETV